MNKTTYFLSAFAVFMILFVSACGGAPAAPVATSAPVQSVPTQEVPTVEAAPTQESAPVAPVFAPACQAASACSAPDVQEKPVEDSICLSKVPWQNFLVPEGTVFEYLPKENDPKLYPLICKDTGAKDGDLHIVGCHGAQLWTYEVKITNPSCGATTLEAGTTSCAEGEGYDAANNCCAPMVSGGESGSVVIEVNLGGCP